MSLSFSSANTQYAMIVVRAMQPVSACIGISETQHPSLPPASQRRCMHACFELCAARCVMKVAVTVG